VGGSSFPVRGNARSLGDALFAGDGGAAGDTGALRRRRRLNRSAGSAGDCRLRRRGSLRGHRRRGPPPEPPPMIGPSRTASRRPRRPATSEDAAPAAEEVSLVEAYPRSSAARASRPHGPARGTAPASWRGERGEPARGSGLRQHWETLGRSTGRYREANLRSCAFTKPNIRADRERERGRSPPWEHAALLVAWRGTRSKGLAATGD